MADGKKSQQQLAKSQQHLEGELAQLARAPALHAGGQGFDSLILHHHRWFNFKKADRAKNNICELDQK